MIQLHSIQVGRTRHYAAVGARGEAWNSAIQKLAVEGPVRVGGEGLEGDEQTDRRYHGGLDKAVLGYDLAHYAEWFQEFPEAGMGPGAFGENLTIHGQSERDVAVGDRYRVGTCLLEVSQPRQPCWKLSARWALPTLTARTLRTARTGWYYRVLEEGSLEAGQEITLVERPYPDFTIDWALGVRFSRQAEASDIKRLAQCPVLSQTWRTALRERL